MNFIEELRWRGLLQDMMPGTEEHMLKHVTTAYVGFDPTAASLGIGNLVPVMLLVHLQRCGHKPVALVGGATGMIGDPSGKSAERKLMDEEQIRYNLGRQRAQLERLMDFSGDRAATIVNNHDWFKEMSLLHFLRDVGKHLTVSYMMAKDSVQSRLETGISYTEFTYQLIQAYDFYHLWKNHGVMLQMGGSDQWGNITSGTELIRRMGGGEAYALTAPLLLRADGTKYGKSEQGNVFLDAELTRPYAFYQFFLKTADADVPKVMKIFSLKGREEIEAILAEQLSAPERRVAQQALAEEMTLRIHGDAALQRAREASQKLFSMRSREELMGITPDEALDIFSDVPQAIVGRDALDAGVNIVELLASTGAVTSKTEARNFIAKNKSVSINMEKCESLERMVNKQDLVNDQFILVNLSKSKRFLIFAR
jgi:tyrosyl-tRNA synthetase